MLTAHRRKCGPASQMLVERSLMQPNTGGLGRNYIDDAAILHDVDMAGALL